MSTVNRGVSTIQKTPLIIIYQPTTGAHQSKSERLMPWQVKLVDTVINYSQEQLTAILTCENSDKILINS